jgi:glucose-1-phosphate cytidylyltransferase
MINLSVNNLPCVILAGGLGTRFRESTEFKPKPMIEIGSRPIIWHIMKSYHFYGIKHFIVSAGYKAESIKSYFLHYKALTQDIEIDLGKQQINYLGASDNWKILISDTGLETMTGGRINLISKHITTDNFFCTYGDAVSDVDINKLYNFHVSHGKIATMMVVRQPSRFGVVELEQDKHVSSFREKPIVDGWVNAGYFIFNKKIFNYLSEESILEAEPLRDLASKGELMAFEHNGFWQPMDTFREQQILEELIKQNSAPWIKW